MERVGQLSPHDNGPEQLRLLIQGACREEEGEGLLGRPMGSLLPEDPRGVLAVHVGTLGQKTS